MGGEAVGADAGHLVLLRGLLQAALDHPPALRSGGAAAGQAQPVSAPKVEWGELAAARRCGLMEIKHVTFARSAGREPAGARVPRAPGWPRRGRTAPGGA